MRRSLEMHSSTYKDFKIPVRLLRLLWRSPSITVGNGSSAACCKTKRQYIRIILAISYHLPMFFAISSICRSGTKVGKRNRIPTTPLAFVSSTISICRFARSQELDSTIENLLRVRDVHGLERIMGEIETVVWQTNILRFKCISAVGTAAVDSQEVKRLPRTETYIVC